MGSGLLSAGTTARRKAENVAGATGGRSAENIRGGLYGYGANTEQENGGNNGDRHKKITATGGGWPRSDPLQSQRSV